jgi:ferredoxin
MPRVDLLRWPIIGPFLKWQHARTAMQVALLVIAGLIIFDGLVGPQLAPKNLATVGVWLHYRGLVVLALLVAGNLFCMACPFMLPRQGARRIREHYLGNGRQWPRVLRNKWLTLALVVLFFFSYELFDLWATPWWTAWLVIGYFLVAFVVDLFFRGASFCKYVCPLGQFNFFGSLISPLEIKVRDLPTCTACRTKDCITAGPFTTKTQRAPREETQKNLGDLGVLVVNPSARGCELALFQQRKAGNMDCTFCLDCIHACPYDNVGLIARVPTAELWIDPYRSGIGRFSRRLDLAALVSVFVFGAYLNAFAMIRPVYALQVRLARVLGSDAPALGLGVIFLVGLLLVPGVLLPLAGLLGRRLGRLAPERLLHVIARYTFALVPMGFGMWLAHYSFHFLTGGLTLLPVVQSFLADIGLYGAEVNWQVGTLVPPGWLFSIEAVMLYTGAFGSIVAAFQMARHHIAEHPSTVSWQRTRKDSAQDASPTRPEDLPGARGRILGAALPWMLLTLIVLAFGLWILVQPMEMRGTMMMLTPGTTP